MKSKFSLCLKTGSSLIRMKAYMGGSRTLKKQFSHRNLPNFLCNYYQIFKQFYQIFTWKFGKTLIIVFRFRFSAKKQKKNKNAFLTIKLHKAVQRKKTLRKFPCVVFMENLYHFIPYLFMEILLVCDIYLNMFRITTSHVILMEHFIKCRFSLIY